MAAHCSPRGHVTINHFHFSFVHYYTGELARLQTEAEQQSFSTQREKQDLEGRLAQAERNTQLSLNSAQQSHLQQLETERRDKEQLCAELTAKCEQIEKRLRGECEDLRTSSQVELQHLQEEMRRLQQDCNAQLLQAENLKQQALSEVEVEKACLSEKLLSLHQEMEAASMETELMRRDFLSRQEQDKTLVCGLQCCLVDKLQVTDAQVEVLLRELQEAQEARDVGRKDLVQARRELRASSEERDAQRKEALELRRSLGDERREKEAVQTSNRELRGAVKRAESDNNSLKRAVEEKEQRLVVLEECKTSHHQETAKLRATLRELERSRLQARRELQELRRQVKTLEGEAAARTQELQELQARVTQEEQREEEAKREAFSLRQKLLESEAGREAALKELEDAERAGQEGLRQHDSAMQESLRRHHDETARLEGALHNAQTQVRELSLRVSLAEEQVQGLGQQLAQSEDTNRDLDQRLAGLVSALRRTLGIRQNGRSLNAGVRGRSLSPWKTRSPVKGIHSQPLRTFQKRDEPAPEGGLAVGGSPRSPSHMEEGDLDAESVRVALCNFQLELKDMQRDRVKPHTRYTHLTHLGKGGEITMEFREKRLGGLYVLFSCRDEGSVNPRLEGAQTSLSLQEEVARRAERERGRLGEEVTRLKSSLQAAGSRSDSERKRLKETCERAEARATRAELSHRSLEGELQRAQRRLADVEAEVGTLQERLATLRKETGFLPFRAEVDRLGGALARTELQEAQLKERVEVMAAQLSESSVSIGAAEEQVAQLQRTLTATEHDRRMLQVRVNLFLFYFSDPIVLHSTFKKMKGEACCRG
uniref:Rootletin n=1 Tax=Denticeps clupeoides TaxID=299321 RepID=A0AAY4ERZ7_9TELE